MELSVEQLAQLVDSLGWEYAVQEYNHDTGEWESRSISPASREYAESLSTMEHFRVVRRLVSPYVVVDTNQPISVDSD